VLALALELGLVEQRHHALLRDRAIVQAQPQRANERVVLLLVCLAGISGFSYAYMQHAFTNPMFYVCGVAWAATVIVVTAMSIYIRAAFFTCLYVWAIEAEALSEAERVNHRPPAPLAAALA